MTFITDRGWTLHFTIGSILGSPVKAGDVVHMPGGRGDLIISGGRAPQRAKDTGAIFVNDPSENQSNGREVRPDALGTVWISAAGGWSALPGGKRATVPARASKPANESHSRPGSSMTFVELTEDEFLARFRPIPNPLSNDTGFDFGDGSCLFDAYGPDSEFVRGQPLERVWTVVEGEDGLEITDGMHVVNRLGYLVTQQPCPPNTMISVPLDM